MPDKLYICPGQTQPITRSVHLARLAAFFPACRECPLRGETGHLPLKTVESLPAVERRGARDSLVVRDGVRGVHRNELTRRTAAGWAGALASLLWDDQPLTGRGDAGSGSVHRSGPAVVVGYDERPSSPDLFAGVAEALRRMGCQVADIGLTTRPAFRFAVDHLHAAAGVLVTGAGGEPSWTGLDFVLRDALPMSCGDRWPADSQRLRRADLRRVEERFRQGHGRPTRQAGPHRPFQALVPYEAGLHKHFHALRPLRVCCATPVRLIGRILGRLFEPLPCQLVSVTLPLRARCPSDPSDPDVRRLGEAVRQSRSQIGLLIDDDGERCAVVDERGEPIPPRAVLQLLADVALHERPGATLIYETAADGDALASARGVCLAGGPTRAEMALAMQEKQAAFGGGASGRYWFGETFPACDGILTLARLLAALSRTDRPLSALSD